MKAYYTEFRRFPSFCFCCTMQSGIVISFVIFTTVMTGMLILLSYTITLLYGWEKDNISGIALAYGHAFLVIIAICFAFTGAYGENHALVTLAAMVMTLAFVVYVGATVVSYIPSYYQYGCVLYRCADHVWLQDTYWRAYYFNDTEFVQLKGNGTANNCSCDIETTAKPYSNRTITKRASALTNRTETFPIRFPNIPAFLKPIKSIKPDNATAKVNVFLPQGLPLQTARSEISLDGYPKPVGIFRPDKAEQADNLTVDSRQGIRIYPPPGFRQGNLVHRGSAALPPGRTRAKEKLVVDTSKRMPPVKRPLKVQGRIPKDQASVKLGRVNGKDVPISDPMRRPVYRPDNSALRAPRVPDALRRGKVSQRENRRGGLKTPTSEQGNRFEESEELIAEIEQGVSIGEPSGLSEEASRQDISPIRVPRDSDALLPIKATQKDFRSPSEQTNRFDEHTPGKTSQQENKGGVLSRHPDQIIRQENIPVRLPRGSDVLMLGKVNRKENNRGDLRTLPELTNRNEDSLVRSSRELDVLARGKISHKENHLGDFKKPPEQGNRNDGSIVRSSREPDLRIPGKVSLKVDLLGNWSNPTVQESRLGNISFIYPKEAHVHMISKDGQMETPHHIVQSLPGDHSSEPFDKQRLVSGVTEILDYNIIRLEEKKEKAKIKIRYRFYGFVLSVFFNVLYLAFLFYVVFSYYAYANDLKFASGIK